MTKHTYFKPATITSYQDYSSCLKEIRQSPLLKIDNSNTVGQYIHLHFGFSCQSQVQTIQSIYLHNGYIFIL